MFVRQYFILFSVRYLPQRIVHRILLITLMLVRYIIYITSVKIVIGTGFVYEKNNVCYSNKRITGKQLNKRVQASINLRLISLLVYVGYLNWH